MLPRFKPGDRVRVRSDGPAAIFAGTECVVETVEADARGITVLDRYVVSFKWGEKRSFYDAQLEPLQK